MNDYIIFPLCLILIVLWIRHAYYQNKKVSYEIQLLKLEIIEKEIEIEIEIQGVHRE